MYIYPSGDHGFGFGPWFKYHDQMLQDLGNWLKSIKAPKEDAIRVACIGNSITDGYGIDMRAKYGYPAQLQGILGDGYWVKNFGVSARTMLNKGDFPYMNEMAWRDALAFKPDVVVIKLGTNDSKPENWQYGAEFKQDLEQMIKTLRPDLIQPVKKGKKKAKAVAQPAGPKILLCTPIPAFKPSWKINDKVITDEIIPIQQEVAKQYGLQVIDLHTLMLNDGDKVVDDGIHPNEKGAKKMAEIIAAAIK
jgi:lysophospholipase L1-like esterase